MCRKCDGCGWCGVYVGCFWWVDRRGWSIDLVSKCSPTIRPKFGSFVCCLQAINIFSAMDSDHRFPEVEHLGELSMTLCVNF